MSDTDKGPSASGPQSIDEWALFLPADGFPVNTSGMKGGGEFLLELSKAGMAVFLGNGLWQSTDRGRSYRRRVEAGRRRNAG